MKQIYFSTVNWFWKAQTNDVDLLTGRLRKCLYVWKKFILLFSLEDLCVLFCLPAIFAYYIASFCFVIEYWLVRNTKPLFFSLHKVIWDCAVIKDIINKWYWTWTNYILFSYTIQSYFIQFDGIVQFIFQFYCILFDITSSSCFNRQCSPAHDWPFKNLSLPLFNSVLWFFFCIISVRTENRHILVYHWLILIWVTQQQTPTLVGTRLFYQSRGSYFDLADNTESVMMFSVEYPL